MKKILFSLIAIILLFCSTTFARPKYFGFARRGGKVVKTSSTTSYKLMETYPSCTITVYAAGTTNLVTIYSDDSSTPKSNPFTADSTAYFEFYINDGKYDIKFSGIGIATPFTFSNILIGSIGGSAGSIKCPSDALDLTTAPYSADNTGVVSFVTPLRQAIADGKKRICLPPQSDSLAGVYSFNQTDITNHHSLVSLDDKVEIFSPVALRSIIKSPTTFTVDVSDGLIVFDLLGKKNCYIHDLVFQGDLGGISNSASAYGIQVINDRFGYFNRFDNLEFYWWNFEKTGQAGAVPISLVQNYNSSLVNTTLGTAISAGVQTLTPPSMDRIQARKLLHIGGTSPENVTVSSATLTTFTANFANAHLSSDPITEFVNSSQWDRVTNIYIHDCRFSSGMVINSSDNFLQGNITQNVGNTANQQCYYIQAGRNTFKDSICDGIGGYGLHLFPNQAQVTDLSFNVFDNFTIKNARTIPILVDFELSNGTNPLYPIGTNLNRQTTIVNSNIIDESPSTTFDPSLTFKAPTYFVGNYISGVLLNNKSLFSVIPCNQSQHLVGCAFGGGVAQTDTFFINTLPSTPLQGLAAFPEATLVTTGGNVDIIGGQGVRKFTVISNTAGAITLTINVLPVNFANQFTLVSNIDFTLGSDNTLAQKTVTASNLVDAINTATNVGHYARAYNAGAVVYLNRNPNVWDIVIDSNQQGRISSTTLVDGTINNAKDLNFPIANTGTIVKSPDGLTCKRIGIDNAGALSLTTVTCP